MIQKLFSISEKYDFEIKNMNSDIDHIHMLISIKPSVSVSQVVRILKQEFTIYIFGKNIVIFLNHIFGKNIHFGQMVIL